MLRKHLSVMIDLALSMFAALVSAFKSRRALALENLALRQQVVMLKRSVKWPRVTVSNRVFWIAFAHWVEDWRNKLYALHPDTVVRWHKAGFAGIGHGKAVASVVPPSILSYAHSSATCRRIT